VALRVDSPGLAEIREQLEQEFRGLLTAQDMGRWTPHVTIQDKAEPREAKKLLRQMRENFEPRPLAIAGVQLVRYLDGEWQEVAAWRFR
jgi:hypothetical protein